MPAPRNRPLRPGRPREPFVATAPRAALAWLAWRDVAGAARRPVFAWRLLAGALVLGLLALLAQQRLPLSLGWALLDEVTHASLAVIVSAWLVPAWGVRPLLVAVLAATAIDLDHVVAAGSFEVDRLMGLGARPITHSVPAALVIGGLVALASDRRMGYAAALGVLSHVLRDGLGPPGVPLWLLDGNPHVVLPAPVVACAVIALASLSLAISRLPDPGLASRLPDPGRASRLPDPGRASPRDAQVTRPRWREVVCDVEMTVWTRIVIGK